MKCHGEYHQAFFPLKAPYDLTLDPDFGVGHRVKLSPGIIHDTKVTHRFLFVDTPLKTNMTLENARSQ